MKSSLLFFKGQRTLKTNVLFVLTLTLGAISCNSMNNKMLMRSCKALTATMDKAESIMNDNPELAYTILDSIDSHSIWRRKDNARYALLYTEALYKNYMPIESDSLIMRSVRYYSDHNNPEMLFRSYYYLGCIYALFDCYTDAAVAYTQAEKLLDYEDNEYRKGLLYSRMGDVFYDSFDYQRAESYYMKAAYYFNIAERDFHMMSAKGMAGNCKAQMLDYKGSNILYDEVIDWAKSVDSLNLMNQFISNKMANYVYGENLDSARFLLDSIKTMFGLPEYDPNAIYQFARYYIESKDYVAARIMLDKAWTVSPVDTVNMFFAESLLFEKMGQLDSALFYYQQSMILNKAMILRALNQPVMGAQRDYYRTVSELEALKSRNRITLLITAVIILFLIIVSSTLFRINRKRKTEEQIRKNLYAIDELTAKDSFSQETIQNLNVILKEKTDSIASLNKKIFELSARETISKSKIQILNSKVRDMLRQQYILPDYLYTRYYEQIDDNKKAERLYKVVKNQIAEFTNPKNIERLDLMLKDTFGNLMERLSSPILGLQEKELLLLRFVLADISAKSMAAILNDSNQNINQRKKRLLEKIGRKNPDLLMELNAALNS